MKSQWFCTLHAPSGKKRGTHRERTAVTHECCTAPHRQVGTCTQRGTNAVPHSKTQRETRVYTHPHAHIEAMWISLVFTGVNLAVMSGKMRLSRQLDLNVLDKSLTKLTDCGKNFTFDIPTFSCKTVSFRSTFRSHSIHHKEDLNCSMYNIDLGFVSSIAMRPLQSMSLCQGLPKRAHFQSRDFCPCNSQGTFLSSFLRCRPSLKTDLIPEPHTHNSLGRPGSLLCLGLVPINVLIWQHLLQVSDEIQNLAT